MYDRKNKIWKYKKNFKNRQLFKKLSLEFNTKGLTFLVGKSGSGKSTLLNMIGNLDSFDDGKITYLDKKPIHTLQPKSKDLNKKIGNYPL